MPIDKRVSSTAEALDGVADGATVFITGFGGAGFPNELIRALRERGPKTDPVGGPSDVVARAGAPGFPGIERQIDHGAARRRAVGARPEGPNRVRSHTGSLASVDLTAGLGEHVVG